MQATLVTVTEKPFLTFWSLLNGGFWVFLQLQFCCNPRVLPMLLIAPLVCAPLCCCTYIWSKNLVFFYANPPIHFKRAELGPGRLTPCQALNTLRSFCFQQQKKEYNLWKFCTSKSPVWDQADTGLIRDYWTATCPLLSCSVIRSIRKFTQTHEFIDYDLSTDIVFFLFLIK